MRYQTLFLMIALVAVSSVATLEFSSLAEIKELKNSEYGKSLVETVSLALKKNGGRIEEITKLLDDLLFKLNKDQEKADAAWKKEKKRLDKKIKRLEKEIKKLSDEISDLEDKKEKNKKRWDQAIKNLKQYRSQRASNLRSLKKMEKKRDEDKKAYKKSVNNHGAVVDAIDAVVKELNKLKGSVSGKGRNAHSKEIAAEKRDKEYAANQKKLKKAFLEITQDDMEAQIFLEIATTADQEALHKLIELLEKIKRKVKRSLNDDEDREATSKKRYTQLKASLESDNKKLSKMIKKQDANRKKYAKRDAQLKQQIANKKKLRASKRKELAATKKERRDKLNQYLKDKAKRAEEKRVIKKLQGIVKKRLANMSKFLKSNVNQ